MSTMSDRDRLKAYGKVAYGSLKVASGLLMATGHGLVGAYLRNHGQMNAAIRASTCTCRSGKQLVESGLAELKRG